MNNNLKLETCPKGDRCLFLHEYVHDMSVDNGNYGRQNRRNQLQNGIQS